MYERLMEEMKKRGVTCRRVAVLLGIHYNTVTKKIRGRLDFSLGEALKIYAEYFSDLDFVELFEKTGQ